LANASTSASSGSWCLATVRHGETDYNLQGRYAGSLDVPLTDAGRGDARRAAAAIRSMGFDLCLCSPFVRALETARLLTGPELEIVPAPLARERDFGQLQGRTYSDVERFRPPIHFIRVGGEYHSVDPPGAEPFPEVQARARELWQQVNDRFQGRRVLLVSHGVFLQQLHGVVRGQDWIDALGVPVNNLVLTVFGMEGGRVFSEERRPLADREQSGF